MLLEDLFSGDTLDLLQEATMMVDILAIKVAHQGEDQEGVVEVEDVEGTIVIEWTARMIAQIPRLMEAMTP